MKKLLLACLLLVTSSLAFADTIAINHFIIKENPFAKDEIAVIATDTANNIQENINGIFTFTLNGFTEQLTFDKGTAFYRHKLEKSSFLYIRHQNDDGTHSMLYYVYRHDSRLTPVKISWILLICIPLGLVLLGYLFKRFIIIAFIIFCIFLYFNHSNGLNISTFFQSIIDGLKGIFV
jgi:opacity protein-like surface antigen